MINSAKHLYRRSWLGLIPVIGVLAGISLVYLSITKYRDKKLLMFGALALIPTFLLYVGLYLYSQSDKVKSEYIPYAKTKMNKLVKEIEFFNSRYKQYPESLIQLRQEDASIDIWDILSQHGSDHLAEFNYSKESNGYMLYSSGLDRVAGNKDDVFPDIDTTGIGLLKTAH